MKPGVSHGVGRAKEKEKNMPTVIALANMIAHSILWH